MNKKIKTNEMNLDEMNEKFTQLKKSIYWSNLKKKHNELITIFIKRAWVIGIKDRTLLSNLVHDMYGTNLNWSIDFVDFVVPQITEKETKRISNKMKKEQQNENKGE